MAKDAPHILIIGLGLIGSSLAYDIRKHKLSSRVTGLDVSGESGAFLLSKGLIQEAITTIDALSRPADMVIIASPPSSFAGVARSLAPHLAQGALVMDAGSVKVAAIDAIAPHIPPHASYVPAHPIAGKAESGAAAGEEGLFENKRVILTPYREIDEAVITRVLDFWQTIGGACEIMDAAQHDMIYAHVSHLPQMIAYASCLTLQKLVKPAVGNDATDMKTKLALFLRLGGSYPLLWTDIALNNRVELFAALQNFLQIISHMKAELSAGEGRGEKSITVPQVTLLSRLFPRIIASAAISVVQLAEHKSEQQLFPYIGTGFADVTAPALEEPEGDIENISRAYEQVGALLSEFDTHLRPLIIALEKGDGEGLYQQMQAAHLAHKHLMQML
jgi:cyclohexadieny/prephenate dehydrogenase